MPGADHRATCQAFQVLSVDEELVAGARSDLYLQPDPYSTSNYVPLPTHRKAFSVGDSKTGSTVWAEVDTTLPHILHEKPKPQSIQFRFTVWANREGVFFSFSRDH